MKIKYETERLVVREWEETDSQDMFEYASDPEVTKFLHFPPHATPEVSMERIKLVRQKYKEHTILGDFCIELKETGKVIGSIAINGYKEKNEGEIEIGYSLSRAFQGCGFMTEALIGMFKYIKRNKFANRISLHHDTSNEKSGNVMKRAGMTFEGVMRKAGSNNFHSRHDIAIYSILDEEII